MYNTYYRLDAITIKFRFQTVDFQRSKMLIAPQKRDEVEMSGQTQCIQINDNEMRWHV